MSVKEAARKLGVGRPALSNLLNDNASLSEDMAVRLEKTFGADRQKLLDMQASVERERRQGREKGLGVRAYVPAFLAAIKARQIEYWAETNLEARQHLSVLLRRLIHSTGHELRRVDFPGYDNAERRGWDGFVEAGAATAWIPDGLSGWEFGVDKDPRQKARDDYDKRLARVPAAERAEITYISVTPRNWNGKNDWSADMNARGEWKAVRAYDASDLEQWLEESVAAQIWLAEKLTLPVTGFETLGRCLDRWAKGSRPLMPREIFEPSIDAYRSKFVSWLQKAPERAFVVAAESRDEALAFLAYLFDDPETPLPADLAAVFESPEPLRTLAASTSPFIPIVTTIDAERELGTIYRKYHSIVIRPRNAVDSEPDIALDLLRHDAFEKALAAMGITGDRVDRLARESGRSPTILRRRLSEVDAIRTPVWARDVEAARSMIPMALIGAWNAKRDGADREVLRALARVDDYEEIETELTRLRQLDDPPVWSEGSYRGVASKIDSLFAVKNWVTQKDLDDFFLIAGYVLSEEDPALELPEDQRWAAAIYGKGRDHSGALRDGVCETLVILSVHGNDLFRERLGFDVEARVAGLIHSLLTPFSLDRLMTHERDLPRYAEAAPDEFLKILQADLGNPQPVVFGLLKPVTNGLFSGCPRTGLLWALECLAWNPKNLPRVAAILAQLSRIRINDNYANKPIGSLFEILSAQIPQTAASVDERKRALDMLTRRYPDVGWQICINQFGPGHGIGGFTYRPHWRNDASGAGQPVTNGEVYEFARHALDLALAWPHHDCETLGDLVERLEGMPEEDHARVWDAIEAWAARADAGDDAKALLRERIRRFALTRLGRKRGLEPATRDRARDAYAKLEPADLVIRHRWLFVKHWVEESVAELEEEEYDVERHEERIDAARTAALQEIWSNRGFEGVVSLLSQSEAAEVIGRHAALCVSGMNDRIDLLRRCLDLDDGLRANADRFLHGFLFTLAADDRAALIDAVAGAVDDGRRVRLFTTAPFTHQTWRLLDRYTPAIRDAYWRQVAPHWLPRHSEGEITELVDRLLDVERPRAAFAAVHIDWPLVETSRLKRLLTAVGTVNSEAPGTYQLRGWDISEGLKSLQDRAGVTADEMALLEFRFLGALERSEHGIPNLERQVAESPVMFVQAVALLYRRSDDKEDPPEWRIEDPERRGAVMSAMHRLLDNVKRMPGTNDDGTISADALLHWLTEVRRLFAEHGRAETGDHCIGQLLAKAPKDADGVPPQAVCDAMETVASQAIGEGFRIGVRNSRGAHWRGEGGSQERDLAAKFRRGAQRLRFDYPYTGRVLEDIAASYDHEAGWHDSEANVRKRLWR
jgi:addiction module HigA family antidote